ncbi:MAG TPA: PEP-CTERM sorting domain-containing protein [Bryobacteraceae bacterium]|jgi:hypothetical protein|nr:PEP-CTERM sorting domain-containing protein [Bryobacteraceae bacterium]
MQARSIWAKPAAGLAFVAAMMLAPQPAHAGLLCAVGTGSVFSCVGPGVADDSGLGGVNITNAGLQFTMADGLVFGFDINESITGNAGGNPTTSAYISITNFYAIDTGLGNISDNIYFVSDIFNPSVAGTAGVGATGYYGAAPGLGVVPVFGTYSASSQAQMNYAFGAPIIGAGGVMNNPPTLSLTTPSTFGTFVNAPPFRFFEVARTPIAGGVVQLVGGLNVTLTSGSEVYMPGSDIVDANDAQQYQSETPEPVTCGLFGSGLIGLAFLKRRKCKQ